MTQLDTNRTKSSSADVDTCKDHPRARTILQALRHGDFSETRLRTALIILEFGYRRGAAVLNQQKYFSILDGRMDASKVSTALKWLLTQRVVERVGGVYFFRPPAEWQVKLRAETGPRLQQQSLEDWIFRQERQLGLKLFELDEELGQHFLQGNDAPVVPETTSVASQATGRVVSEAASVVPKATPARAYFHDRNQHEVHIMPHATQSFLDREFEVGALGRKSAREILEAVCSAAPDLSPKFRDAWLRRIGENAQTVWFVATEVRDRIDVANKAGWMNRAYLRETGVIQ